MHPRFVLFKAHGDGVGGKGCSRGKRGRKNTKSKCHLVLRQQQDKLLPSQTLERMEGKRDPSSHQFPYVYLSKIAPTSEAPLPGWMRSEKGRWEAGKGQSMRLAQVPLMGL